MHIYLLDNKHLSIKKGYSKARIIDVICKPYQFLTGNVQENLIY